MRRDYGRRGQLLSEWWITPCHMNSVANPIVTQWVGPRHASCQDVDRALHAQVFKKHKVLLASMSSTICGQICVLYWMVEWWIIRGQYPTEYKHSEERQPKISLMQRFVIWCHWSKDDAVTPPHSVMVLPTYHMLWKPEHLYSIDVRWLGAKGCGFTMTMLMYTDV